MALSSAISEARNRGAEDDQILDQFYTQNKDKQPAIDEAVKRGANPSQILDQIISQESKVVSKPQPKQKGALESVADVVSAPFEKAGTFLFGTAAKTVGSVIGSGVESAAKLAGKDIGNKFTQEAERLLGTPLEAAKNIGFTVLEVFPGGPGIKNAVLKIPGGSKIIEEVGNLVKFIPDSLRESAIKSYSQALGPTTKEMKAITEKVVPKLIEKGETALTRTSLLEKAREAKTLAWDALDEVLKQIPEGTMIKTKPIIDVLENTKKTFFVPGTDIAAEPQLIQHVDDIKAVVEQLGEDVSFQSLRGLRQIWDKTIQASHGFMKTLPEGTMLDIKKTANDAIRDELAKTHPNLDRLNKEYSFWTNVEKVLTETVKRTTAQATPLSQQLMQQAGVTGGLVQGGIDTAILTGTLLKNLLKITQSTGWRTVSAIQKDRLADYIRAGNINAINLWIGKTMEGIKNLVEEPGQPPQQ